MWTANAGTAAGIGNLITDAGSDFRELFGAVAAVGRTRSGWTRPPWSAPLREAEEVVVAAAARSGLVSSHDAAGNLWLTDPAAEAGLVAAGSHLDTVPDGGAFDGALGVVSALVAVARLRAAGVRERAAGGRLLFADEEGWRFGTPIFGSRCDRASTGRRLAPCVDADGARLGDAAPPDPFAARGEHRRLSAFIRVHVEQGRAARRVSRSASHFCSRPGLRFAFVCEGAANHAGTTPMTERRWTPSWPPRTWCSAA